MILRMKSDDGWELVVVIFAAPFPFFSWVLQATPYSDLGILHSPVYTFFEKVRIIELNADAETRNLKFEIR